MRPRDLEHFPPVAARAHTPGPWKVHEYIGGVEVLADDDRTVAEVFMVDNSDAMTNARLIAAAPDLLEALRLAESYMFSDDGRPIARADHLEFVQAALAKAGL